MGPEVDKKEVSLPEKDFNSVDATSPSEGLDLLEEAGRQAIEDWDDLPESIYSIFFVSDICSASFLFAIVVFVFQTAMASLILVDFIDLGNSINPLGVPPGVTSTVRVAQGLSLALAVLVQNNMKQAVQTLYGGYDSSVLKMCSNATMPKWLVAYILQFCVGAILLAANFTLIVRSNAVIELFFNFAALEFISQMDDVAFLLAKNGYITNRVKDVCGTIQEHKIPQVSASFFARRIATIAVILGMFGGWIDIIVKQNRGDYLCKSLLVQFGDDFIGFLPTFSGSYDIVHNIVRGGRAVYTSRGFNGDRLSAFRYCQGEKMWVFGAVTGTAVNLDNLCNHWLLRTTETETFDVASIPFTSWLTQQIEVEGLTFPVDHLFLQCNDCSSLTCQGRCMGNVCVCPPERFGDRCEFDSPPCPKIDLDRRTPRFETLAVSTFIGGGIATSYDILMTDNNGNASVPVRLHNRPVYFNNNSNSSRFDAIFFNGRRWVIYDSIEFEGSSVENRLTNVTAPANFAAILSSTDQTNPFHVFYDVIIPRIPPLYISGPLDIGTASNSISPADLAWFAKGKNKEQGFAVGRPIESRFVCARCDDSNTCLNFGQCIDGRCECMSSIFSTSGELCELLESCVDHGCQNGGQCNQGSGICSCPPEFSGNLCQAQSCGGTGVICFNNGTCNQDNTGCDCPLNFGGFRCSAFDCNLSGCRNGGTCGSFGLECECLSGFGGLSCEIPTL